MPALSHIGLGLAAKRVTPKVTVIVLVIASIALDILAGIFWVAGTLHIMPADNLAWSHGLFMSILWSLIAGLFAGRICRDIRTGIVIGVLVFSHWLLDFLMWKPSSALLFTGGPEIGLDLGNPIGLAIAFEFAVLLIGILVYIRTRIQGIHAQSGA